jgi:hypothetical protein
MANARAYIAPQLVFLVIDARPTVADINLLVAQAAGRAAGQAPFTAIVSMGNGDVIVHHSSVPAAPSLAVAAGVALAALQAHGLSAVISYQRLADDFWRSRVNAAPTANDVDAARAGLEAAARRA